MPSRMLEILNDSLENRRIIKAPNILRDLIIKKCQMEAAFNNQFPYISAELDLDDERDPFYLAIASNIPLPPRLNFPRLKRGIFVRRSGDTGSLIS
jgi:hypothetical protein